MGHSCTGRQRQPQLGDQVCNPQCRCTTRSHIIPRRLEQEWDQVDDKVTTNADRIYVGEDNQALSTEVVEHWQGPLLGSCVCTCKHTLLYACCATHGLFNFATHACIAQDIEELRNQGVSGQEIVERLAQGSKNFENKTEFAQRKWLKRKAKKYCPYAIVRRPCASTICEVASAYVYVAR